MQGSPSPWAVPKWYCQYQNLAPGTAPFSFSIESSTFLADAFGSDQALLIPCDFADSAAHHQLNEARSEEQALQLTLLNTALLDEISQPLLAPWAHQGVSRVRKTCVSFSALTVCGSIQILTSKWLTKTLLVARQPCEPKAFDFVLAGDVLPELQLKSEDKAPEATHTAAEDSNQEVPEPAVFCERTNTLSFDQRVAAPQIKPASSINPAVQELATKLHLMASNRQKPTVNFFHHLHESFVTFSCGLALLQCSFMRQKKAETPGA
jgi:hypothetical protein